MIRVQLDKLLRKHSRTFYWPAKQTGITHTTLWRLKKGKALGINFETLEKICEALECQPGDILTLVSGILTLVSDNAAKRQRASEKYPEVVHPSKLGGSDSG